MLCVLALILSILGATATEFLEWLTPSSLSSLAPYSSTLSVILNEKGGIIDDTVVTKHSDDSFYVVTNAGRRDRDLAWIKEKIQEWNNSKRAAKGEVTLELLDGWGLVALQGIITLNRFWLSFLHETNRSRSGAAITTFHSLRSLHADLR